MKGRRQEVLDAAARIFYEKGYEATSIQDIADALGILKGSLYYYINSKEDLLYELMEGVHRSELARLDVVLQADGGPVEKLRLLIESHVIANLENWRTSAIFFHDFRSLSEERRRTIIVERDRLERTMRELIVQGQAEGIFDKTADPKILTLGILGMANSFHLWYHESGGWKPAEIASQCADFTIRGLTQPAGRKKPTNGRAKK